MRSLVDGVESREVEEGDTTRRKVSVGVELNVGSLRPISMLQVHMLVCVNVTLGYLVGHAWLIIHVMLDGSNHLVVFFFFFFFLLACHVHPFFALPPIHTFPPHPTRPT